MEQTLTVQHTLLSAVRHLTRLNGGGFSDADQWITYALARKPEEQWQPVEKRIAYDILWNYAEKLRNAGIIYSRIPAPPQIAIGIIERYMRAAKPPVNPQLPSLPLKGATVGSTKIEKKVDFVQGKFHITCPWNNTLVARLKNIPTHRWRPELGKVWTLDATSTMATPLELLIKEFGFTVTQNAQHALTFIKGQPSLKDQTLTRSVGVVGYTRGKKMLAFDARLSSMAIKEALKDMGGKYSKQGNQWVLPLDALEELVDTFPTVQVLPELNRLLARQTIEYPPVEMPDFTQEVAPGRKLFPHQIEAVQLAVKERYLIIADDMGLGKTFEALVSAKILRQGKLEIIVLCPPSLQSNWEEEAEMINVPITIVSWSATNYPQPKHEFILIADEGHYSQNLDAQRTRRFIDLGDMENCVAAFPLTGTPLGNGRPEELLPMLKVTKHPLGRRVKFFKERYCAGDDRASNLDELHRRITQSIPGDPLSKAVMLRREDKILNLPPLKKYMVQVKMSDESMRLYQQTFLDMQKAYREKAKNGGVGSADAIVMLNHLRQSGSLGKVEESIKMAKQALSQGKQVVLFTEFLEPARRVANALMAGVISGDTNNKQIKELKEEFQRGALKTLVCTFKRGGCGHTLHAGTVCILIDRPWTPGSANQSMKRLHRIGQDKPVDAYWLRATKTDLNIDDLILAKSARIELVLQGKRKSFRGTGNMNDVAKELASMLFA